ncbi:hypothetical protein [Eisenbergiella tayi]|nr:hypothetical protein [Eisenbergiella tayi]
MIWQKTPGAAALREFFVRPQEGTAAVGLRDCRIFFAGKGGEWGNYKVK